MAKKSRFKITSFGRTTKGRTIVNFKDRKELWKGEDSAYLPTFLKNYMFKK